MANTWRYSIRLPPGRELEEDLIEDVLAALAAEDVRPPALGPLLVYSGEGATRLRDEDELVRHLKEIGGMVTLPGLSSGPTFFRSSVGLYTEPTTRRLDLSLLHELRPEVDEEKARVLERVFRDLCEIHRPRFGYSSDEDFRDQVLAGGEFPDLTDGTARDATVELCLAEGRPQPLLYWLNYFDRRYWEQLPHQEIEALATRVEPGGDGFYVYLADLPWKGPLGRLGRTGRYTLFRPG